MKVVWKGAAEQNYMPGRDGETIDKIICHWVVGTLEAADATFQDGRRKASAHYGIGDDDIHQYVKDEDTAFAAGDWEANKTSLNLEHEGGPDLPISDKTYETSAKLIKDLCEEYDIPIDKEHILPHNHFQATQCPGDLDINRLIKLAKSNGNDTPLKETKIDWYDFEGNQHTVGWYVYEWKVEKENVKRLIEEIKNKKEDYEKLQKQVSELNQTNTSLKDDLTQVRKRRDKLEDRVETLEKDKERLNDGLNALEKKLLKERQNYIDLEKMYTECKEKLKEPVQDISFWKFIWLKLRR